jgi:hypothetical protein
MFTNADITLYQMNKNGTYTRKVIEKVFWDEVKQSNVLKSGMANSDSVTIFIPKSSVTDTLSITTGKDLVINGKVELEIDNASPQTISGSLRTLTTTYETHTINAFDKKLFGSEEMKHYQLSCK